MEYVPWEAVHLAAIAEGSTNGQRSARLFSSPKEVANMMEYVHHELHEIDAMVEPAMQRSHVT